MTAVNFRHTIQAVLRHRPGLSQEEDNMSPRNSFRKLAGVCFVLSVFMVQLALAQSTATIKGKVLDASTNKPLPGANVLIMNTSIGTATDLDGNYILRLVPLGPWTLKASFVGYKPVTEDIMIRDNTTLERDFQLTPEVIEGQEVVVTAQALGQMQAINQQLASDKIANIVSEARIQELPDFNAAQAIARLPGVSTLQSSGEANKVVIRGLAPQYNAVAVGGITLAATGGTQIGVSSLENTAGRINTDRSVDLTMITPYMIKSVEVYKTLTPDMNANVIGGFVNMNLREAPSGFKTDVLAQTGYTQKSGKYGNYRFVAAASDRFFDDAFGAYLLGNMEAYDRDADNMDAYYTTQSNQVQANGFRPVEVTRIELNRHFETRHRYGGNLILDYRLPSGYIKASNVLSRLSSDAHDHRTIMDYQFRNLNFRYREGTTNTDMALNSLEFVNDFGFFSAELRAANSYSRNYNLGSPQFSFSLTNGLPGGMVPEAIPESLATAVNYPGSDLTLLTSISLFSADFKANDQVYKGDFKVPFSVGAVTSGFLKFGGEFRYNLRTNKQGTPYAGMQSGSPITDEMHRIIDAAYPGLLKNPTGNSYTATNFTSPDPDLIKDFLSDRFGSLLWASREGVLNGIVDLLSHSPTINAIYSSGTNAGGWFDGPYQHLPNQYKYIEKYYAGYLMGEVDLGQMLRVVGGVRWEEVKSLFDAFNLADGRDPRTQIVDSVHAYPYNRFLLPMVQAKWSPLEWVDLRYSYTKTLARPDYNQLSPHFSMNVTRYTVWAGNPRLQPAVSQNHDVYLTFHSNELGLLSIGAFYKEVRNFTFSTRYPLHNSAPAGLDSVLSYKVRSSQGGTVFYVSPNDGAFLNTYSNSEAPAFIRGIELDFQTRLWYLPEPFNGTLLGINYTLNRSSAVYPFRYDTTITIPAVPRPILRVITLDRTRGGRLIDQPNDIVNAYLGYDYGGFSGRLSFVFQGNSVSYVGSAPEADGYTKDYFRIDLSARQKLPWFGLQVFLDVYNLNNRRNESAQTSINGFTSQQYYGLTANLGLRYTL